MRLPGKVWIRTWIRSTGRDVRQNLAKWKRRPRGFACTQRDPLPSEEQRGTGWESRRNTVYKGNFPFRQLYDSETGARTLTNGQTKLERTLDVLFLMLEKP